MYKGVRPKFICYVEYLRITLFTTWDCAEYYTHSWAPKSKMKSLHSILPYKVD